jgi:hypothetical protein
MSKAKPVIVDMDTEFDDVSFDERLVNWATGAKNRSESESWYKNTIEKNKRKAQDPEWIKKVSEKNREQSQDPNWKESQQNGCKEFWNSEEGRNIRSKQQKLNWQLNRDSMQKALKDRYADGNLNKKISDTLKNSNACKENGKRNMKPLVTPNGMFASRKEAANFYKIHSTSINQRIKNYPTLYYYITREEYERLTNLNK